MLTYAAEAGHTFYDRRLYLPAAWADDAERRHGAGVPEEITFATDPQLGIAMLETALARGLPGSRCPCPASNLPTALPTTCSSAAPPSRGWQPTPTTARTPPCGPSSTTTPCPTCSPCR
ncbi:transposase [Streptomyces mirabilis]